MPSSPEQEARHSTNESYFAKTVGDFRVKGLETTIDAILLFTIRRDSDDDVPLGHVTPSCQ